MHSCKHRRELDRTSLKLPSCSYTPHNLLSMECPVCGELRYSRDWARSQWRAESAITWQFNCCKVCCRDYFFVDLGALAHYCHQIERSMAALQDEQGRWIAVFQRWMKMPYDTRKYLSYYGGIRLRVGDDRMSLVYPNGGHGAHSRDRCSSVADQYHDPGNFVYGLAMRMMWPEFLDEWQQYNNETIGDLFEGILGHWYLFHRNWSQVGLHAHALLEDFLYWVFQFACAAKDSIWQCNCLRDVKAVALPEKGKYATVPVAQL